jgi:hypothetical protein
MPNPALFPAPPTRKQVEGRVPVMTMKHEDGREVLKGLLLMLFATRWETF